MKNKNILLFGGTFDPIHNGHLIVSQYVFESLKEDLELDKIILLPNGEPPHKQGSGKSIDRFIMCKLSTEENDCFDVSDYEIIKNGPSYTFDTVCHFIDMGVNKVYLLIGLDAFQEIETWNRSKELIQKCNFVVMHDSKYSDGLPISKFHLYAYRNTHDIRFVRVPMIEIRSTIIRERVKNKLPITYYVPSSIESYIQKNGLYL